METTLRILMFALGSGGDVYPNVLLGKELRRRGHEVLFATTSGFAETVQHAGLEFVPIGDNEATAPTDQNPDLWKFPDGVKILFNRLLDAVPETYQIIEQRNDPTRTVIVANFMSFGARVAREKLGVPLATVHLQPVMLRSLNVQPGRNVPARWRPLLRPFRRLLTYVVDKKLFDPVMSPRLNAFRAELGLEPKSRWMNSWVHSPDLVLGMFPPWFAEPQPDWPPHTLLTGFPLADSSATPDLSPDAQAFLNDGEPPIVFTFGTAMAFGGEFFRVSSEVCSRLGRRGIFLTRFREQIPTDLPKGAKHFDYLPLEALLPHAAALVHHGGVGTTAQALAAGCRQLIVPMNFDQPDNAARVVSLGVGASLRPHKYRGGRAADQVKQLLESAAVSDACRRVTGRFGNDRSLDAACTAIEALGVGY